ncbi:MAG: hypothetical protein OXB92_09695 [Acidimicrobiaceae bacterium]|nr:hypothetical protein [Acidimicrobiaceae bacterium]
MILRTTSRFKKDVKRAESRGRDLEKLSDIHRRLRIRAAAAGQSLQQYMLDAVCKQADLASAEELLARKRVEALAFGESDIDPELIVEIVRADREFR